MKEKRNIYCLKALTVAAIICFAGCSDDFLKDKKVYGSYDSSVVYENYETATSRVDYLYQCLLPSATGGSNALTDITSAGGDDDFSKCTEEYGGYSAFNNPSEILTIQTVPDYFYVINGETSPWGRIRECNDVIEGVTGSATLSKEEKELFQSMLSFVHSHYQDPLTVRQIAAYGIINKNRCTDLFRKYTRLSPIKYLNEYRLYMAKNLILNTKKPISEISADVGYNQISHFIEQFRGAYGLSPLKYRNQFAGQSSDRTSSLS